MDWERISRLLEQTYGNPRHGNPTDPTDSLFYLMLSRKTPIPVAAQVLERLRSLAGNWSGLISLSSEEIAQALHGSGLEAIRAEHIKQVAGILKERFGEVTLSPLREWPDEQCLKFLTKLPGVGVKTALCVMMYSFGRYVFPADAHCIRVLKRLGAIPPHLEHRPAQKRLAAMIPPYLSYKLHVNLLAHGQRLCRPIRPVCDDCFLQEHCAHVQAHKATLRAAESPSPYMRDGN